MTATPTPGDIAFVKGHGTENDFVLIPDRQNRLSLTRGQISAICDRRAGIGADGVIRVATAPDGQFLMDYHNADGSPAEMCGNGARVFARFLVDAGWQPPGRFDFVTRGGARTAEWSGSGDVSITMGPVRLGPATAARLAGRTFPGVAADVGNPHLVCVITDDVAALDLSRSPEFDPGQYPDGVNVEFVQVCEPDRITMRVFERGVGETRSCGTGTVAAAAAHLNALGRTAGVVTVGVPGGQVRVVLDGGKSGPEAGRAGFAAATLVGPAVLVAHGTLDPDLFNRPAPGRERAVSADADAAAG